MSAKELYEFDSKSNSELKQKDKENTLAVYSFEPTKYFTTPVHTITNQHSLIQTKSTKFTL